MVTSARRFVAFARQWRQCGYALVVLACANERAAFAARSAHAEAALAPEIGGVDTGTNVPRDMLALFEAGEYHLDTGERNQSYCYRFFKPGNAAGIEKWPLIVWVHGHGGYELTLPNVGQLKHVQLVFEKPWQRQNYPFYFLCVQCPPNHRWVEADKVELQPDPAQVTLLVIDRLMNEEPIDANRIYLVGISSGGSAAWEMLRRRPDFFAAAAPLACAPESSKLEANGRIGTSIWAFRSIADDVEEGTEYLPLEDLQKVGINCAITLVNSGSHDCWTAAFQDYDLLNWLLAQRRGCVECPLPGALPFATRWRLLCEAHFYVDRWAPHLCALAAGIFLVYVVRRHWLLRRMDRCSARGGTSLVSSSGSEQSVKGRSGFTLVEVLVVIAIIGILVAMLLPAVEMARESSRRSTCANNLRQQAVSIKLHTDTHQIFPTGGWEDHLGNPDAGYGPKQPGGWIYNILSFIEQDGLRQLGRGVKGPIRDEALTKLMESPIEVFYCPSRRLPRLYPYTGGELKNAKPPEKVAKTDYAISGTISYEKSEVIVSDIQLHGKGMTKTVLVGEKSLVEANYSTGTGAGDRLVAYVGDSDDIRRSPSGSPTLDNTGGSSFGGPHPGGANIAYCDGSVRFLNEDEEIEVSK